MCLIGMQDDLVLLTAGPRILVGQSRESAKEQWIESWLATAGALPSGDLESENEEDVNVERGKSKCRLSRGLVSTQLAGNDG